MSAAGDVSRGYEALPPERMGDYAAAWQAPSMAAGQRALADVELERYRAGQPVAPFDAWVALIRSASADPLAGLGVMDVGCGAGYYAQVLEIAGLGHVPYLGVDYSEAMVAIARERAGPGNDHRFTRADGSAIPAPSRSWPIVTEGCVIVHVADWRAVVRECARVADRWMILHRTPYGMSGERTFRKLAYGVPCAERWFCEADVHAECYTEGFELVREIETSCAPDHRVASTLWRRA